MAESYEIFGQSLLRVDAPDKLKGKAIYAGDISLMGMLHLKILRSDRPHAKILKIHTEKAETHPGVVGVFTHKDIPGMNRVGPETRINPFYVMIKSVILETRLCWSSQKQLKQLRRRFP